VEENSGTRFEPEVVDTCLKLFRDGGYKLFRDGEEALGPSWRG